MVAVLRENMVLETSGGGKICLEHSGTLHSCIDHCPGEHSRTQHSCKEHCPEAYSRSSRT